MTLITTARDTISAVGKATVRIVGASGGIASGFVGASIVQARGGSVIARVSKGRLSALDGDLSYADLVKAEIDAVKSAIEDKAGSTTEKSISSARVSVTPAGSTLTIDVSLGNIFMVMLTADIASLAFVGWPSSRGERVEVYVQQDATGGRTIDLSSVLFSGARPALSAAPNAIDRFVFASPDGVRVFGDLIGDNYQ